MARQKQYSAPTRDLENLALFIAIVGGISSQIDSFLPRQAGEESIGMLLWLIAPSVFAAWLIAKGHWWRQVGVTFDPRKAGIWTLVALALPALLTGLLLSVSGAASLNTNEQLALDQLLQLASGAAGTIFVKNLFEEFVFRGFFTSRFERSPAAGIYGHLLTGVVWAIWHLPYWLVFLGPNTIEDMSGMPPLAFVAMGTVMLILQSLFYGELRLISGSVWPVYVFHCVCNLISFSLLEAHAVSTQGIGGVLFGPGTHGLLFSAILAGLGLLLMRERKGALYWDTPSNRLSPDEEDRASQPKAIKQDPKKSSRKSAGSSKKHSAP